METNETIQRIMPAVIPVWDEFDPASYTANTTYMVTSIRGLSNFTFSQANVTLIFAGGRFTGTGTITGNNTTFVAPPIQVFDVGINFAGTWNMEKVYAENFDTITAMNTNAAQAINKALEFSNISGCVVQLLSKTYNITTSITMRGNTTLQGTIWAPDSPPSSASPSKYGTLISTSSIINMINIITNGQTAVTDIDCYRFAIKDLTLRHSGATSTQNLGNSIYIESTNTLHPTNVDVPRTGIITNVKIRHTTVYGYAIRVIGGSYIVFENIIINGGRGVSLAGNKLQEFLYFNRVILNEVTENSFEITHGNNIYLNEIDTNDSVIGLLINNQTGETYNVFVNRFNSVRCAYGIYMMTFNNYLTRIKVSEASIYQELGQPKTPNSALFFTKGISNSYIIDNCIFENINVDAISLSNTNFRAIRDNNNVYGSRFINIKTSDKIDLHTSGNYNNQLTILGMKQGGIERPAPGSIVNNSYTFDLYASNSPLPEKPVVLVSSNQTIPISCTTSNTQGGKCSVTVNFSGILTSNVEIYYFCTGYFYT